MKYPPGNAKEIWQTYVVTFKINKSVHMVSFPRATFGSQARHCLHGKPTPLYKAYAHVLAPAADSACPMCMNEPHSGYRGVDFPKALELARTTS